MLTDMAQSLSPFDRTALDSAAYGWINIAMSLIDEHGAVVRATVIEVKGSAPRDIGAAMFVTADSIHATIGGGSLEFEIMAAARAMMSSTTMPRPMWQRHIVNAALGPDMGQCCGGYVRVLLELLGPAECDHLLAIPALAFADTTPSPSPSPSLALVLAHPLAAGAPPSLVPSATDKPQAVTTGITDDGLAFTAALSGQYTPLFLYGAGHIGRALIGHLVALDCDVHWVDIDAMRFPSDMPLSAHRVIAANPAIIAKHAPSGAIHLVVTHSHALDEAICHQLLTDDNFARLGLIGSATKAARFRGRLAKAGIGENTIEKLVCPMGLAAITGKAPARVALSIAAQIAVWQQELDSQQMHHADAGLN